MKTICITFLNCIIIILTVVGINLPSTKNTEYLRIHIRANSNEEIDQRIKYEVKASIVHYLTPLLAECKTKQKAQEALEEKLGKIEQIAEKTLGENNFDYGAMAKICAEEFPTRVYQNLTLESGFYDALIIELGEGKGDNWWCVVYPPLCFVESGSGYVYKSKILQIIKEFFYKKGENNEENIKGAINS